MRVGRKVMVRVERKVRVEGKVGKIIADDTKVKSR